ncbi:SAM-dependent methyltransferase [Actinoallomurus vinaceus]|uniref:SAM-dependent methyltransferase n=1 Tax=Actinoallomurus vinaceus TaxID=1080074 RepID=A0ABP8U7D9_9ACTN
MALESAPPGVDITRPSPARVYDYALGGSANYPVDRQAAEEVWRVAPETRQLARDSRGFLIRAVRFLADEAGIDQFLDIGAGLPTADNVHQVARRANPRAQVVYVDNDPTVRLHAEVLLDGDPNAVFLSGDVRRPEAIIERTRSLLDLDRPVALLLVAVLHFVAEDPRGIVDRLIAALPPGSHLVIAHTTSADMDPAFRERLARTYADAPAPLITRTPEEIEAAFRGRTPLPPGLVDVACWRTAQPRTPGPLRVLGGVARL